MAREFAKSFYKSKAWETVRNAYMRMGYGLCEPCLRRGEYVKAEIVHHKVHLDPSNVNDPKITLDFDNLERVCRKCHADEHPEIYGRTETRRMRMRFDEEGNVIPIEQG